MPVKLGGIVMFATDSRHVPPASFSNYTSRNFLHDQEIEGQH